MRTLILGLIAALAVLASGAALFIVLQADSTTALPAPEPVATPTDTPTPTATLEPTPTPRPTARALLTGEQGDAASAAARNALPPVAVMVDNAPGAIPQIGLNRADVVIEALVEGGISRFFAVFQSQEAERIEPVRSARTPFLYWALEYGALYAHVGTADAPGPADAASQIYQWKVRDVDMAGGPGRAPEAYHRDPERPAPHNVITSTGALRLAAEGKGYDDAFLVEPWTYRGGGTLAGVTDASVIEIVLAEWSRNRLRWEWNPEAARYLRWQDGAQHMDGETQQQLAAANVVVIVARAFIADANGHVLIETIGQGPAIILSGGGLVRGTWKKPTREGRTRFYGPDDAEVRLAPGPTWIEVADPSGVVEAR